MPWQGSLCFDNNAFNFDGSLAWRLLQDLLDVVDMVRGQDVNCQQSKGSKFKIAIVSFRNAFKKWMLFMDAKSSDQDIRLLNACILVGSQDPELCHQVAVSASILKLPRTQETASTSATTMQPLKSGSFDPKSRNQCWNQQPNYSKHDKTPRPATSQPGPFPQSQVPALQLGSWWEVVQHLD